jgi:hypothetical protein
MSLRLLTNLPISGLNKGGVMRAEVERAADEIKQALALLRRHL